MPRPRRRREFYQLTDRGFLPLGFRAIRFTQKTRVATELLRPVPERADPSRYMEDGPFVRRKLPVTAPNRCVLRYD
jgi:hypothetical protein